MNGELAQAIALATHGSAWLRDPTRSRPPPELDRTNTTFQFVRSVSFVEKRRWRTSRQTTVASWLGELAAQGVERLWLDIPAPGAHRVGGLAVEAHQLMAFSGAGTWQLLGGERRWRPVWELGDPEAADQRIWDVRYEGVGASSGERPRQPAIASSSDALADVLGVAHEFAAAHDLDPWTEWFEDARTALVDPDPAPPYHPDLVPSGYPLGARRLLAAATRSWVFGGMGSWNDLGFEDRDDDATYRSVTRALYDAVLVGFVAAVNVAATD